MTLYLQGTVAEKGSSPSIGLPLLCDSLGSASSNGKTATLQLPPPEGEGATSWRAEERELELLTSQTDSSLFQNKEFLLVQSI